MIREALLMLVGGFKGIHVGMSLAEDEKVTKADGTICLFRVLRS
jgi:hypothetical protein